MIKIKEAVQLLQELISARGPGGEETEVRNICVRELKKTCDDVQEDTQGNVIGLIRGCSSRKDTKEDGAPVIRVMVHMDEIAMIIKRVNPDGTLIVKSIGGFFPSSIGQGPVDILGDKEILTGVLSFGCVHTTKESAKIWQTRPDGDNKALAWEHSFVFTGKTVEALKKSGVHAGTRVVVAQSRRELCFMGDYIGGYFMDDRVAIVSVIFSTWMFKDSTKRPAHDVYFVMTKSEESGCVGGSYASHTVPGDLTLAVDVAPVAEEYNISLTSEPVIVYGDAVALYDKTVCDRLLACGYRLGMKPQCVVLESYGSDASGAKSRGLSALAGLIAIPTQNTHGFEIIHRDGILKSARLLVAYLEKPV